MCKKCDDCKKQRLRYWIGRNCAEAHTCTTVWLLTLTYGGGDQNPAAQLLRYSDVQKLMKRLRKAGFSFRYFVAGEYGEKGRAHWHVILYCRGDYVPLFRQNVRYNDSFWTEGFIWAEQPRSIAASTAYCAKYLMKQDNIIEQSNFLGEEWMMEFARERARFGETLFHNEKTEYTVPGIVMTRPPKQLQGTRLQHVRQLYRYIVKKDSSAFDRMVRAYAEEWMLHRPNQKRKQSRLVSDWCEKVNGEGKEKSVGVRDFIELQTGLTKVDGVHRDVIKTRPYTAYSTDNPSFVLLEQEKRRTMVMIDEYGKELRSWPVDPEDQRENLLQRPRDTVRKSSANGGTKEQQKSGAKNCSGAEYSQQSWIETHAKRWNVAVNDDKRLIPSSRGGGPRGVSPLGRTGESRNEQRNAQRSLPAARGSTFRVNLDRTQRRLDRQEPN